MTQISTPSEEAAAPPDRFCDLVMKGGITSGVVYPPAIAELARQYRFKNIGGTSAGAIAAVVTAAAEFNRRRTGSLEGFGLLEALPDTLAEKGRGGRTRLLRLFQPDPAGRRLFGILVGSLNAKGTTARLLRIAWGSLISYLWAALIGLALTAWAYFGSRSILATLLTLLVAVPLCVGAFIYWDVTRGVVGNFYGLCKGLTRKEEDGPALTDWLHQLIQKAAGLPLNEPLTFEHLWKAPGFPPEWLGLSEAEKENARSIDLQMFTTNVTHGRPYLLPHVESTARLFFRVEELEGYLPADVLKWFVDHGRPYTEQSRSPHSDPPVAAAEYVDSRGERRQLMEIPAAKDFPVLLAARMSLSFPVLFAAVPLWAIDYEHLVSERAFRRCLFSDGGICSNFPMHLFDGLLPNWPTFGIQLEPALPGFEADPTTDENLIFLPHTYGQGIADRWNRFDENSNRASRLGGFLMSMVGTMQNWNDNVLARMPGVRDRVVRVRLVDDEGGLNLGMGEALITRLGRRGKRAAHRLMDRFLPGRTLIPPTTVHHPSPADAVIGKAAAARTWPGWDFQRFVRLDVLLRTLSDKSAGLRRALGTRAPHATPYVDLIARAAKEPAPGHPSPLNADELQALNTLARELLDTATTVENEAPHYPNNPIPNPDLRVRPSL